MDNEISKKKFLPASYIYFALSNKVQENRTFLFWVNTKRNVFRKRKFLQYHTLYIKFASLLDFYILFKLTSWSRIRNFNLVTLTWTHCEFRMWSSLVLHSSSFSLLPAFLTDFADIKWLSKHRFNKSTDISVSAHKYIFDIKLTNV